MINDPNNQDNTQFLSIAEIIKLAKNAGFDFGSGDPLNRLRYYTKSGLIPHAVRRQAIPGQPYTTGYYPAYTLGLLLEIQKRRKKGESSDQLARTMQEQQLRAAARSANYELSPVFVPQTRTILRSKNLSWLKYTGIGLGATAVVLAAMVVTIALASQANLGKNRSFSLDQGSVLAASVASGSAYLEINADTVFGGKVNLPSTNNSFTVNTDADTNFLTVVGGVTLDQNLSKASSPTFANLTLTAGTLVLTSNTQTLTNKTLSGSSNTFSSIPNSALSNSKVTVTAGTNLSGGGDISLGSSATISLKDNLSISSATISGNLGVVGEATVSGTLYTGGRIMPAVSLSQDIGSSALLWGNIYAANFFTGSSGTAGFWQRASGALAPTNITDDLLVGGMATSSAKLLISGLTGNLTGATATFSGTLGAGGNATINADLAVKGNTNIVTASGYYQIAGTNVLAASTLGSGVITSSLTTVGALTGGSIASGFGTIATANTITGTTLNGTTGINTGATAGTQRIDASGNMVNIGSITATGTLTNTGSATISGTLGVGGEASLSAKLVFDSTTPQINAVLNRNLQLGFQNTGRVEFGTSNTFIDTSGNLTLAGLTASKTVFTDANKMLTSTGTVGISQGGTGVSSWTNGQLLIGNTTGNTAVLGTLTGTSNQITVTNGASAITLSTPQNINTAATPTFGGLTISGNASVSGTLGAGGHLTVTSNILPTYNGTQDIGSPTNYFQAVYANNIFSGGTVAGFWQRNLGALAPANITDDLLVGGNATASAKFQVYGLTGNVSTAGTLTLPNSNSLTGVSGYVQLSGGISVAGGTTYYINNQGTANLNGLTAGTTSLGATTVTSLTDQGTASIAGALTLYTNPVIAATNMQSLTLGNTTTGNITLAPGNVTALTASGANLTAAGTLTLPNSNTLTGVSNYIQFGNGISVGGGTTYNIANTGASNLLSLTLTGSNTALTVNNNATVSGILGVNTATVSGILTLDAAVPTIAATNMRDLLLGGGSTGGIKLAPKGNLGFYVDGNGNVTMENSTGFLTLAVSDLPSGGNIGTAANTVDKYTAFALTQTTGSQTITLPSPTTTTAGRLAYLSNTGSTSFTFLGSSVLTGTTTAAIWNGSAWTLAGGGGLSQGTVANSTLRWNSASSQWVENTALTADSNGNATTSGTLGVGGEASLSAKLILGSLTPQINATNNRNLQLGFQNTGRVELGSSNTFFNTLGNLGFLSNNNTGLLGSAVLTAGRTWTLPDNTGTICLSAGNCAGTGAGIGGSGTTNKLAKFTAQYNIGDSGITDDGTTITLGENATASGTLGVSGEASLSAKLILGSATPQINATNNRNLQLGFQNTGRVEFLTANSYIDSSGNLSTNGTINGLTVSSGTISSGTWQGTKVAEGYGGTNQTTYLKGDTLYASGANTLAKLPIGSSTQVLVVSAGGIPAWATIAGGPGGTCTDCVITDPTTSTTNTIVAGNATTIPLTLKGAASQSVALLSVLDSASATKFQVDSSGNSTMSGTLDVGGEASLSAKLVFNSLTPQINATNNRNLQLGFQNTGRVEFFNTGNYIDAAGNLSLAGLLTNTGNATISGTLGVGGEASLSAKLILGSLTPQINATNMRPLQLAFQNTGQTQFYSTSNYIDSAGNIVLAGAGTFTSTITGTTLNGTTGINTGAGAGTQRIDASGNLLNLGNITATGTLTNTGSATISGTLGVGGEASLSAKLILGSLAPQINATNNRNLDLGFQNTGRVEFFSTSNYIDAAGNLVMAGNLTTSGTLSLPNSNSLTGVSGYVQFNNGVSVGGATTYHLDSSGNANLAGLTAGTTSLGATTVTSLTDQGAASVSGALTLYTVPTIATTAKQSLTLGDSNTGKIQFYSLSNTVDSSGNLVLAGNVTAGTYNLQTISSAANFTGTVAVATSLTSPLLDAPSSTTLGIGATNQTALTIGRAGATTAITSSDWAIGTTGNMTGIGAITADGILTVSNNATISGTLGVGGNTTINADLAVKGNTNIVTAGGFYQINGTNVLSGATLGTGVTTSSLTTVGALASGSIASGFGTISTANTITGTTLNATTGINTGAGAGTNRVDSSGNLANIGTIAASGGYTQTGTGANTFSGATTFSAAATALTINNNATVSGLLGVGTNASVSGKITLDSATNQINATNNRNIDLGFMNTGRINLMSTGNYVDVNGNMVLNGNVTAGTYNSATLNSTTLSGISSFTITGGTGSGNTLTLVSSSHGTKGNIQFFDTSTYITSAGNLVANGTITGTTLNGTTGINTGAVAGTQRIDASGNLVNIGNITATGTLTNTGTATISGTLGVGGNASMSAFLTLDAANPIIKTTNLRPLTIGNAETGDIKLSPGSATPAFVVTTGGNVGIGTTAPAYKLEVIGNVNFQGAVSCNSGCAAGPWQRSGTTTYLANSGDLVGLSTSSPLGTFDVRASSGTTAIATISGKTSFAALTVDNSGVGDLFTASSSGLNRFVVTQAGNVGIGTTGPVDKLEVVGGNIQLGSQVAINSRIQTGSAIKTFFVPDGDLMQIGQASGWTGIAFQPGTAEAVRITNQGNVGIGTTAPGVKLHVNAASGNSYLRMESVAAAESGIVLTKAGTDKWFVYEPASSDDLRLNFGGDRVTFQSGGNVGIGTTGPGAKLHVVSTLLLGSTGATHGYINTDDNLYVNIDANSDSTGNAFIVAKDRIAETGGTELFRVQENGNVGIGTTGPFTLLDIQKASPSLNTFYSTLGFGSASYSSAVDIADLGIVRSGTGWNEGHLAIRTHSQNDGTLYEVMRITGSGNLGIGTTSPSQLLSVAGAGYFTGNVGIGATANPIVPLLVTGASVGVNVLESGGAVLTLRSTTASGADIGPTLRFTGSNGASTDPYAFASIAGRKEGSAGGFAGYLQFNVTNSDSTIYERMRINSSGNVGIGTTGPGMKLEIVDPATNQLKLTYNASNYMNVSYAGHFDIYGGADYQWAQGGSVKMVLQNGGNVGIGTTGPTDSIGTSGILLDVSGSTGGTLKLHATPIATWGEFSLSKSSTGGSYIDSAGAGTLASNDIIFRTGRTASNFGVTEAMRINNQGNVGIGTTSPGYLLTVNSSTPGCNGCTAWTNYSDQRLKENINTLPDDILGKIMELNPISFNYNDLYYSTTGYTRPGGATPAYAGFVAQQLQTVFPEMVSQGPNGYLDTNLSNLQIYLVKGIQEQQAQIASISGELAQQKSLLPETLLVGNNSSELVPDLSSGVIVIDNYDLVKMGMDPRGTAPLLPDLTSLEPHLSGPIPVSLSNLLTNLVNNEATLSGRITQNTFDIATISAQLTVLEASNSAILNLARMTQDISQKLALIPQIQDQIASLAAEMASVSAGLAHTQTDVATNSAQLAILDAARMTAFDNIDVSTVSASFANFSESLKVIGTTQLAQTTIGGALQVGLLHFDDLKAEISSLTGLVTILGDATVSGQLRVEKGIIIKDKTTGEDYCMQIDKGEIVKTKGACQ